MSNFLFLTILLSILGVVLMIIYLIDRVNLIEKMRVVQGVDSLSGIHSAPAEERFEGLDGELLWNALSGTPPSTWSEEKLCDMRKFCEPVIDLHVMEVFEIGRLDARQGIQMPAEASRVAGAIHGQLASWFPLADSRAIYNLGQDRERSQEHELPDIRARVDEIYQRLRSQVGLLPGLGIGRILLPVVELPTLPEGGAVESAPQADRAGSENAARPV